MARPRSAYTGSDHARPFHYGDVHACVEGGGTSSHSLSHIIICVQTHPHRGSWLGLRVRISTVKVDTCQILRDMFNVVLVNT